MVKQISRLRKPMKMVQDILKYGIQGHLGERFIILYSSNKEIAYYKTENRSIGNALIN